MAESRYNFPSGRSFSGFTLVEIAIVLVILGLLIAGASRQFGTLADNDRYGSTDEFLERTRQALLDYSVVNGHLPCPDSDATPDGKENRTSNKCDAYQGGLPYVDLGLPAESDWDAELHYAIHRDGKDDTCSSSQTETGCFFQPLSFDLKTTSVVSSDALQVYTEADKVGDTVAKDVLAVVISFGSNSSATESSCNSGSRGDEEKENCDNDLNFVKTGYRGDDSDSPFDDQLVWIGELDLKYHSMKALDSGADIGPGDSGGTDDPADKPEDANEPDNVNDELNKCQADSSCSDTDSGSKNDDTIVGDDDADCRVYAGKGDDIVYGLGGADCIYGDKGNDILVGGSGGDTLWGQQDNDLLVGGSGIDRLYGGLGEDIIYGGTGDDHVVGEQNDDTLYGGDGNDILNGDEGNDKLYGGKDNDNLNGEQGDDILVGSSGNDSISGGTGQDYIHGGPGADDMRGENGNDSFVYKLSDGIDSIGVDDIYGGNSTDTIYVEAGLGAVTFKQSGTTQTVSGTSLTATGQGELYVDGVKWANFTDIEKITIGSP